MGTGSLVKLVLTEIPDADAYAAKINYMHIATIDTIPRALALPNYRSFWAHEFSLILAVVLVFGVVSGRSNSFGKVKIDVHQSDESVRAELLDYTPIRSDADRVLEFVHLRLYHEGGFASGVGIMPRPGISVDLGHIDGIFAHQSVVAEWRFDDLRKLQTVVVKRFYLEGSYDARSDPPSGPKVKIDLHQTDEAIRAELLGETPLGTADNDVLKFIQTRLYCQSAIASGQAVMGKPGIGMILGEYRDPRTSRHVSVRANWSFNERRQLKDIEIKRVHEGK
jgi:hypothetical protein